MKEYGHASASAEWYIDLAWRWRNWFIILIAGFGKVQMCMFSEKEVFERAMELELIDATH